MSEYERMIHKNQSGIDIQVILYYFPAEYTVGPSSVYGWIVASNYYSLEE